MTYIKADKTAPSRMSYNDRHYRDYRNENHFASEYGKNIAVNNSVSFPDRSAGNNLLSKQQHNSERKKPNYAGYNREAIDENRGHEENGNSDRERDLHNNGEQKTRSLPRYSKMTSNKVSSPFFQGDDRLDQANEGGEMKLEHNEYPIHQMHSAAAAERREDVKSEYQRNRYDPIGKSYEGPIRRHITQDLDVSNDDFISRTNNEKTYEHRSDFASAHFKDEKKSYHEDSRANQRLRSEELIEEASYPGAVNS